MYCYWCAVSGVDMCDKCIQYVLWSFMEFVSLRLNPFRNSNSSTTNSLIKVSRASFFKDHKDIFVALLRWFYLPNNINRNLTERSRWFFKNLQWVICMGHPFLSGTYITRTDLLYNDMSHTSEPES